MSGDVGLRARKKAATKAALSQAAIRLAMARGVDGVTAEAIAEAANVSPRTFHNYFANKEEAILEALRDQVRAVADAVRARPTDEPIWDSLQHVGTSQMSGVDLEEAVARGRLVESSPALLVHSRTLFEEVERTFAEVVAERTGSDVDRDLYPHLISAAALVAFTSAMKVCAAGKSGRDPADLLAEAFAQMRAGLPEPTR